MKLKWQQISDTARAALAHANGSAGPTRPHIRSLLNILEEAAVLPVPEQSPGGLQSFS